MNNVGKQLLCLTWAACIASTSIVNWGQTSGSQEQRRATEERLQQPGWWPTKATPRRDEYIGPLACAECHSSEAEIQQSTPMAHAYARAAESEILRAHPPLSFHVGSYVYETTRTDTNSLYSVSVGTRSISVVLTSAFGNGEVGQTYLFKQGGVSTKAALAFSQLSRHFILAWPARRTGRIVSPVICPNMKFQLPTPNIPITGFVSYYMAYNTPISSIPLFRRSASDQGPRRRWAEKS